MGEKQGIGRPLPGLGSGCHCLSLSSGWSTPAWVSSLWCLWLVETQSSHLLLVWLFYILVPLNLMHSCWLLWEPHTSKKPHRLLYLPLELLQCQDLPPASWFLAFLILAPIMAALRDILRGCFLYSVPKLCLNWWLHFKLLIWVLRQNCQWLGLSSRHQSPRKVLSIIYDLPRTWKYFSK